ncbi:MAG TPA: class I SAM-dependent methyltransferase [Candidatus Baltobacteraceae bacterium]|nr:class I SAM-dependent methyltransferase [Candidatus Baltobacteraceae bacterium]
MNGRLYDAVTKGPERKFLGPIRATLLGDISGEIVELGAGTGLNFPYYSKAAHVRAIEPNASMLANTSERSERASARIELLRGGDDVLDAIAQGSLDAVVATLVFCSVDDPKRTMQRVLRVLKPGGRFVTMEHVRDTAGWGWLQSLLSPVWSRLCANCHLDRDMEHTIREAGFSNVELQERKMSPPAFRLLYGIAVR